MYTNMSYWLKENKIELGARLQTLIEFSKRTSVLRAVLTGNFSTSSMDRASDTGLWKETWGSVLSAKCLIVTDIAEIFTVKTRAFHWQTEATTSNQGMKVFGNCLSGFRDTLSTIDQDKSDLCHGEERLGGELQPEHREVIAGTGNAVGCSTLWGYSAIKTERAIVLLQRNSTNTLRQGPIRCFCLR